MLCGSTMCGRGTVVRWAALVAVTTAVVAGALSESGCSVETGAQLEITGVVRPEVSACVFGATNAGESTGFFDPMGDAENYQLAIVLRNNMQNADEAPLATANIQNIRPRTNDVTIKGYDACWYVQDGEGVRDCGGLPAAQRSFLTASGGVEQGGNLGVAVVRVLTLAQMRGMFGDAFDPMQIPPLGVVTQDTNNDGDSTDAVDAIYSLKPEDPSSDTRNAAWGTFPTTRQVTVVFQLMAVGTTQTGETVKSNMFSFPIELCMGCVSSFCGDLTRELCQPTLCDVTGAARIKCPSARCNDNSVCAFGSICADTGEPCPLSQCPEDGSLCFPERTAFAGRVSSVEGACLPYQGYVDPVCGDFNGCTSDSLAAP